MTRTAEEREIQKILEYIGNNYGKSLYLYLNLKKYGLSNPNVRIWVDGDIRQIRSVILKYYNGMHIFSLEDEINVNNIEHLINEQKPTIICAEKRIIEQLEKCLASHGYDSEYGYIRMLSQIGKSDETGIVKKPSEDDFVKITNLLLSDDDIGGSYSYESMHNQIVERYKEKYGRNYIIKDGDKVIAHAGTGAENDKIGILNYVITDPDYRRRGLAVKLCTSVCHDLISEGKDVFLINYSDESTALYDKLGFKVYCECGKLYKKGE